MNTQKGFSKILIIIILLLITIIGVKIGGTLIHSYNEGEANKKRAESYREPVKNNLEYTEKEILNWKIYENSEFGFSFKYPSDWKVMDYVAGGPIVAVAPNDYKFKDGTESPYGYFVVTKNNNKNEVLDTGWDDAAFLGEIRSIISSDKKLKITLIPFNKTKAEVEAILNTFSLSN
ncbi:MAG: hypothetical protein WC055_15745 [Melioribacteraceae bacterium]